MWKKTVVGVNLIIMSCLVLFTYSLPDRSSNGYEAFHRMYRPQRKLSFGLFPKRACHGFPCMYTHLGAKAGRQALMRTMMSLIGDCVTDPSCSPGKRKRRSLEVVEKRLNQIHKKNSNV